MSLSVQAILAALPILLAAGLLVAFRWPARRVMPLVYFLTISIGLLWWEMSFSVVAASSPHCWLYWTFPEMWRYK